MLVREIRLTNLLSYGRETAVLALRPLNVLIGPNGSGKSNLIEAISLLQAAPVDVGEPVRRGGGVQDWICKTEREDAATIHVVVENPRGIMPLRHVLQFHENAHQFEIADEIIENERPQRGSDRPFFFYRYQNGRPVVNVGRQERALRREDVHPKQSILSQRRDPDQYPEITYLADSYGRIRIYRNWVFGRNAPARGAQDADLDNRYLAEDFLNLGMVLNRLRMDYRTKQRILEAINELYPGVRDFDTAVSSGKVQVFFHEGETTIPATRLSDGTLRWLCLIAILLDPDPPPLMCIEEPELGLHPDVLPFLADLMRRASESVQLIVTTHSETFVDAFTDCPEDVIVCEKRDGLTALERLSSEGLAAWLETYTLGQLWSRGDVGGNRW